ncbi:type II toxin-antitoxin system RelE/ParE family toxin [Lactobacillus sp. ZJLC29-4]|uniref:Type II toxin-antitoxin system RelE/ParE family toxin n=1 Tax=Levilactobacillus tujiorum TaxID=2912243 RepID=A0ABX1LCH0_9LACO|nr:type II toxin-antitoxin system RelE/ParE family toxin [Lactobacillus sp. HBUAS51387]NLR30785.1 type II toxin-antitoxin system RelE/ParE family toxin [Levilactobacillus tujiorum]
MLDPLKTCLRSCLRQQQLPPEFEDHELNRRMSDYNEFHLRDTPKNKTPSETNDVLVVYTIDTDELVLIGIRVGSHDRLFPGQNRSKRYRKTIASIQITKKDTMCTYFTTQRLLI